MKANKNRIGNKDWLKAEVRLLGQILAAQNIEFVLRDTIHIAEFFAEILLTIPGIIACRVCLEDVSVQRGEMESGVCEECQTARKKAAGQEVLPSFGSDFRCRLADQPGRQFNAIDSLHHHFGFFVFQISDLDAFNVYKPFIGNLANYVAISLENRLQRDLLQTAHDELERRVEERTQDLVATNVHLQKEIESKRQIEAALKASEKQVKQLIDTSPIAMVVSLGIDDQVESVNDKFIELFGYTIEDMPNAAHWWPLAYPNEEYREMVKTQWQAKVEQAIKNKAQIEPMEATVTCKDGSLRYVEFRLSSIGPKHLITFVDLTDRKQAEDELLERERHSQSLLRLSRNLEQARTYAEVLNAARNEVRNIIGYQNLWAYLFTEDKKHAKALVAGGPISDAVMSEDGLSMLTIEGDRLLEEIAEAKEIVVVEDARTDERTDKEIVARLGNRTIVNIPIILFDRHLGSVGTGTFGDEVVRVPSSSEQKYLIALASHMAASLDRIHLLIEHKRAEQALHRLNRELLAISNCNQMLLRAVDEQTLLNDICRIVCNVAGYHMAWVGYAENDEAKTVHPAAWAGHEDGYLASTNITWADTERGRGPTGTAIRSGKSACIQDFMADPQAAPWRANALQRGYRSSIALPLKDESARTFGVLNIYSTEPNAFTPDEIRLLDELAGDLAFGIVILRTRAGRKQAEEALRTTKILLEQTLEQSPVPMVLVSMPDVMLRYVNPACRDFLGINDEPSLIDTPLMEIKPSWQDFDLQGRAGTLEELPLVRSLMGFKTEGEERCIIRKDGTIRYELASGAPIFDETGQIIAGYLIMMDITERKRADEELRQSKELLRVTLTNILDPVFVTDNNGNFIFICPNVLDTLGYSVEEIQALGNISKLLGDSFFNPEELEMRGEITNIERLIVDNLGRQRVFLATVKQVSIGEGTRLYALHDITERKQADDALKRRKDELERFERLTIGRELRMVELKKRISELETKLLGKE